MVAASALILVRGWVISRDYRPCQYSKHSSCWKAGSPHQNRARHMLTHVPRHWGHRLPLMCVHTPIFSCSHMHIPARAHSHTHAHSNEHPPCSGPGFSAKLCVHTLCCVHPTRESSLCSPPHTQSIPSPIPIASDGSDNRDRDNGDNGALWDKGSLLWIPCFPASIFLLSPTWVFQNRKQCPISFPHKHSVCPFLGVTGHHVDTFTA